MKFSIITPCFNSGAFIGQTLDSISGQDYPSVENIVVDGGSTDNTLDILKSRNGIRWISEKDKGQSDAINKGFRMATGEILAWQNADDLYLPGTFSVVARFFQENPEVDLVYGGYQVIDTTGKWVCDVHSRDWNLWLFKHGRIVPPQPSAFWRRRVYEQVGELDLSLHYCMDVDFYCRVAKSFQFRRIQRLMGKFRVHDGSKTQNSANQRKVYREHKRTLARHFGYNAVDYGFFELFYYRSRLASYVKRNWLKKL